MSQYYLDEIKCNILAIVKHPFQNTAYLYMSALLDSADWVNNLIPHNKYIRQYILLQCYWCDK